MALNGEINGHVSPLDDKVNGDASGGTVQDLEDKPVHSQRHLRIIVIGAGASGLCLAYKLQRSFSNFTLKLYEKNDGVSGTWLENRYPG